MDMKEETWLEAPVTMSLNFAKGFYTSAVRWLTARNMDIIWSKESEDKEKGVCGSHKSLHYIKAIWDE